MLSLAKAFVSAVGSGIVYVVKPFVYDRIDKKRTEFRDGPKPSPGVKATPGGGAGADIPAMLQGGEGTEGVGIPGDDGDGGDDPDGDLGDDGGGEREWAGTPRPRPASRIARRTPPLPRPRERGIGPG
jgi:hypothetical protein